MKAPRSGRGSIERLRGAKNRNLFGKFFAKQMPLIKGIQQSVARNVREDRARGGMKVLPSRSKETAEPVPKQRPMTAMIEIDHVSQVFQTSARKDHLALSDITLTIEDGAFVSILGPSGCGKSTLLYIVGGFVKPTEGIARMKGKAILGPGPDRGPVFQEFALFPWKSVLGN